MENLGAGLWADAEIILQRPGQGWYGGKDAPSPYGVEPGSVVSAKADGLYGRRKGRRIVWSEQR